MTQQTKIWLSLIFLAMIIFSCEPATESSGPDAGPAPTPNSISNNNEGSSSDGGDERQGAEGGDEDDLDEETAFAELMLEFKSVLNDDMVSPKWTNISTWENACVDARSVEAQAKLLIEFETGILWSGVSSRWKGRRASWFSDVENAGTLFELGRLLAELETNVTWESVDQSWRQRRASWIKEVTQL